MTARHSTWTGLAALAVVVVAEIVNAQVTAERRVTAGSVMERVQQKGAAAALESLFEAPQWESILDGIAGGGAGWLRVAGALRQVSDAGASEDLDVAISEALGVNAAGVLLLVKNGSVPAEDACYSYGFMTQRGTASKVKLQRYLARRREAVTAVTDPGLAKVKVECLAALDIAEQRIDLELKKP